jgi:hypothetical protein
MSQGRMGLLLVGAGLWGNSPVAVAQVSGIVARVTTQGTASVSWTSYQGATSYFVLRWHTGDASCCKGMSPPVIAASRLSWDDGTLPKPGTYAYRIYATTPAGTFAGETRLYYEPGVATTSESTGPSTSTLIGATPGTGTTTLGSMPGRTTTSSLQNNTAPAPTGLRVTLGGVNFAKIGWDAVQGATGYEVRRAVASTISWTLLTPTPTTDLSYPAGNLAVEFLPDPTKSYTYQVTARQADGRTASASVNFTPPPPEDPRNFAAVQTGEGQVELSWVGSPGAAKFLLSGPGVPSNLVVEGLRYTVKGLSPGSATWTVATMYEPGGVLTPATAWPKTTLSIVVRTGRYRVTMFAFEVKTQTREGIALDGFGDEVYLAARWAKQNMATQTWSDKGGAKSVVFGDVIGNSGRVQAGSAGPQGGLATGNVFPVGGAATAPAAPKTDILPMLVWEGDLTDDDLVLIAPSIWETDGDAVNYSDWTGNVDAKFSQAIKWPSILTEIGALWINPVTDRSTSNDVRVTGPVVDHPLGMTSTIAYSQQYLLLTRRRVEAALSESGRFGVPGPGGISVTMSDETNNTNFGGSYTVYLRIERVP